MGPELQSRNNGDVQKDTRSVGKHHVDWATLRARSLLPGGFGEDRVEIWYGAFVYLSFPLNGLIQATSSRSTEARVSIGEQGRARGNAPPGRAADTFGYGSKFCSIPRR